MLNKIVIMVRLTHDPEMRQTGSGTPVTSFSLAVERDYSGRDGGEKQTDFIDVGGSKRREAETAPAAYDARPVAVQPTEADMERLDELVSAYDNVAYADDIDGGDLPY